MCRRVFYHFMHCDVREPITVPERMAGTEAGIYENFLRTSRHRCETRVKVHDPEQAVLLGGLPVVECEWHSCCLEGEEVFYCDEGCQAMDNGEDFEPEMCDSFRLEHQHSQIRSPCFGGACRGLMCLQNLSNGPVNIKGRWPDLGDPLYETWDPVYRQPAKLRAKWEERLFKRMAKLTTINKDLATHAAVLHDISGNASPSNSACIEAAARNYLRCNRKVQKQQRRIERGLMWAATRETQ